jgi:hypothetical protein
MALAQQRAGELVEAGQEALVVWDESVLDQAESLAVEGFCAVRSSLTARLKRIKPGGLQPMPCPYERYPDYLVKEHQCWAKESNNLDENRCKKSN